MTFGEKIYIISGLNNSNSLNFNDCLTFKFKEGKNYLENNIEKEINSNIYLFNLEFDYIILKYII